MQAQDASLKSSLASAADSVKFVREEVERYCLGLAKRKTDCEDISESGKFKA